MWKIRSLGGSSMKCLLKNCNVILLFCLLWSPFGTANLYSNQFAIHVPSGEDRANEIAKRHGFINLGQIGSLSDYYLLEHSKVRKRSVESSSSHHKLLDDEPDVLWFEQQVEKKRVKRDFSYYEGTSGPYFSSANSYTQSNPIFYDPLFKEQWYLTGGSKDGFDMNVVTAWRKGYSGKGVVVSILDDGIQPNHPDLIQNYDPRASTDINDNDSDPTPQDNGDNKHGTRCAGEVAAQAGNNICGVGVAFNSSIGGVRMLDGTVNDAVEAKALGLNPDHVDIYSASWGPEDDGKTVDGPGPLARRAFIYGVTNGRRGLGSIFVWASGNGGRHVDSCNCDGYTNSIFTLSISSATQGGYKPWYLEECASTLATTYSSGTPTLDKSVATVDMDGRLRPDHICTVEHTGTSASAPLAAGIAALALEANRNLSWRDLQHLVVMTSRSDPLEKEEGWYVNGVNRKFSHKFGYGLMDAGKMVDLASNWIGVPPQHICKSREIREDREIPGAHLGKVKVFMDVDGCAHTNSEIRFLEHVQCKISLRFFPRGNLRILLTSPMGTTSVLLFERPRDVSSSNFDDWPFLSVHFWGEQAHGRWTLEIINSGSRRINQPGILKKWQLILYGTDVNPVRLKGRSVAYPAITQQPYESQVSPAQPQYRQGSPLFPRYIPQEYLYGGASETVPKVEHKPSMNRTECKDFWIPDLQICVNDCPEGYFGDDKKECLSCQQRCKSCYNATSCRACEHNLVLYGTQCLSICPEGHYEADSSCEKCELPTCASCGGPMGKDCIRCKSGFVLLNNECVGECPEGFRQTKHFDCSPCSVGCSTCDGEKCTNCSVGYLLDSKNHFCTLDEKDCPKSMFMPEPAKDCMSCGNEDCIRCIGPGQCVECAEGLLVHQGDCLSNCYEGLFTAANKKECLFCPKLCTKCESSAMCSQCRSDAYLQEGQCLPHCSNGYYNDAGTCALCSPACKTCIGGSDDECVMCSEAYEFRKGKCAPSNNQITKEINSSPITPGEFDEGRCPESMWLNPETNSCEPCHETCSKCNGGNAYNCRSCVAPFKLDRGSSQCIPCCSHSGEHDCCHCEDKRHAQYVTKPLILSYSSECHFVSRRVSESEEKSLSSGTWDDSLVLSFFWLSVFFALVALFVIFQRRKRDQGGNPLTEFSTIQNGSKQMYSKYLPVSLGEEHHLNHCDGDEDEESCGLEFDLEEPSDMSEGVPLVLKT